MLFFWNFIYIRNLHRPTNCLLLFSVNIQGACICTCRHHRRRWVNRNPTLRNRRRNEIIFIFDPRPLPLSPFPSPFFSVFLPRTGIPQCILNFCRQNPLDFLFGETLQRWSCAFVRLLIINCNVSKDNTDRIVELEL